MAVLVITYVYIAWICILETKVAGFQQIKMVEDSLVQHITQWAFLQIHSKWRLTLLEGADNFGLSLHS